MADDFTFPFVTFSLITGAVVILIVYVTKLVKSVVKETKDTTQEPAKQIGNLAKKQPPQQSNKPSSGKKKNADRRNPNSKQNFNHPWLMTSLKGHTANILDMDISPNGKYLATCAEDRTILLWRSKDWTEREHKSLRVNVEFDHGKIIKWSPDSKAILVVKSTENEVQVYRIVKKNDGWLSGVTKGLTYPKLHTDDIIGLGIPSNGKFIATCSGKTELILSDIKGVELATIDTLLIETYCAGVTPCGRFVYASGFAPDAKLWEVQFTKTGEFSKVVRAFEFRGHTSGIYKVAFNADSTRAATVSKDGTWRLYNINVEWKKGEDPKLIQTGKLPNGSLPTALALSPTGNVVAVSCSGVLYTYFADTAELDTEIPDVYNGDITQILFDAQGKYILTAGDKHVRIFHNVTGHKATAALAKAKLTQPGISSATRERLELQIETAEALVASLG